MPIAIISESYNGLPSLYANAGDLVSASFQFTNIFTVTSSTSNTMSYNGSGGTYRISIQTGDFANDFGFAVGDTLQISCDFTAGGGGAFLTTRTITYINGNLLYLDATLNNVVGFNSEFQDGRVFPADSYVSGLTLTVDKAPDSLEFLFNLVQQEGTSMESLIDSEVNILKTENIDSLTVGGSTGLTQINNKSGGYITNGLLTYESITNNVRKYKIDFDFWQWGVIQDGYTEPNYYQGSDHLAPIIELKAYSQNGNPNGVLSVKSTNTLANTGGFNENFNGGNNNFSVDSVSFFDYLGDQIQGLDYSNPCTINATISGVFDQVTSEFYFGLCWRPEDTTEYQNLNTNIFQNLMVNIADNTSFPHSLAPDPTLFIGSFGNHPSRWDVQNIKFEVVNPVQMNFSAEIIPTPIQNSINQFSVIPDGGRKISIWLGLSNPSLTGTSTDKVNLLIYNEDCIDAPTKGVNYPDHVDELALDHGGVDITGLRNENITTEDDVYYKANFLLTESLLYDGINTRIFVLNPVTNEEFVLEENFFSFDSVPFVSDKFEPNISINRGFNLPPTTDRNEIKLYRNTSIDTVGKYGLTLEYGFLSRWEYWLEQSNVNNAFFDASLPLNGKNKNWQKYSTPNWKMYVEYNVRLDNVDDFHRFELEPRPYEDDPTVSAVPTFTVLADGTTPVALPENELVEVSVDFLWVNSYINEWVEFTIEDYESGNRWVISSVLDKGGISANPFEPLAGQDKILLTPSGTTLNAKALLDTSKINVDCVSLSYRVYSEEITYEVNIDETLANEDDGTFNLSMQLLRGTGDPLPTDEFTIKIYNNDKNIVLGSADFVYGDDISSATPVSGTDNNFTTLFQPYFETGTLMTNGGSGIFDKKNFGIDNDFFDIPYNKTAISLKIEIVAPDNNFGNAILQKVKNVPNSEYCYCDYIDANNIVCGLYEDSFVFIYDKTDGTSTKLNFPSGGGSRGVTGIYVDRNTLKNGLPIILVNQAAAGSGNGRLVEFYYSGSDGVWNSTSYSATTTRFDFFLSGSVYNSQKVDLNASADPRGVVYMGNASVAGSIGSVDVYAWDSSLNDYVEQFTLLSAGSQTANSFMWNDDGSKLWVSQVHNTPSNNYFQITEFDITGSLDLSSSYTVNRVIDSNLTNDDFGWQQVEIIGTDGNLLDFSGSNPMFAVFGGDRNVGSFNADDVKILSYDGANWVYSNLNTLTNGLGSGEFLKDFIKLQGSELLIGRKETSGTTAYRIKSFNLNTNALTDIIENDTTKTTNQRVIEV